MKSNFFLPITPRGLSTIAPPPPWHYSGDFLVIDFWSDPKAAAAVLPKELEPDYKAEGHAQAYFVDWQFSGENDEFLDPARYQYREFFILVDALYQGKPVSFCPHFRRQRFGHCTRVGTGLPEEARLDLPDAYLRGEQHRGA